MARKMNRIMLNKTFEAICSHSPILKILSWPLQALQFVLFECCPTCPGGMGTGFAAPCWMFLGTLLG